MRSCRAASRPRRAASLLARWRTRRCPGLTMRRRRFTSTFGSPGAGSTTAVRSSTAVTQTRRPSTSASKSGRISSSSSIETLSRRTSSLGPLEGVSVRFRFEAIFICQIPDRRQDQTQDQPPDPRPDRGQNKYARYEYPIRDSQYSRQGGRHDPRAGLDADISPKSLDERPAVAAVSAVRTSVRQGRQNLLGGAPLEGGAKNA